MTLQAAHPHNFSPLDRGGQPVTVGKRFCGSRRCSCGVEIQERPVHPQRGATTSATLQYTRKIDDEVDKHVYEHHPSLESLQATQRLQALKLRTGRYWWYGTWIGAAIVYVTLQKLGAEHWPRFAVALPVVVGCGLAGVVSGMHAQKIERTVHNVAVGMLAIAVSAWLFHLI